MNAHRLDAPTLGRATLARQLLLTRADLPVEQAVAQLAGLNAQDALPPYLSLWARLTQAAPRLLTGLLEQRTAVRGPLLRNTQHIVTTEDYLAWRPVLQPALDRSRKGSHGRATAEVNLTQLAAAGRKLLTKQPMTRPELGRSLAKRWPDSPATDLARSVQALVPIVHPPPAMTWQQRSGATPFALATEWTGRALSRSTRPDPLVLRYLAAFGPATVKDAQAWSGLTRLGEVFDRLSDKLQLLHGPDGQLLYDLPDAPRPAADTDAAVRLLPMVDNLLTAHADRRRLMSDATRKRVCVGAVVEATVLVDGAVHGIWRTTRDKGTVTLSVQSFTRLARASRQAVEAEAYELLAFTDSDADRHEVTLTGPT